MSNALAYKDLETALRNYLGSVTNPNQLLQNFYGGVSGNTQSISPATSSPQQSQTPVEVKSPVEQDDVTLTGTQKLLLQMYSEFVKKDDGKQLASEIGKFARFIQSEVAKTSDK
jgi:hypothetical protein